MSFSLPPIRQKDLLSILKARIEAGVYRFSGLPAERELADEIGVARMTARKTLQRLVDDGTAKRLDTGRLLLSEGVQQRKLVVILIPDISSKGISDWLQQSYVACEGMDVHVTPVFYESYMDVTLTESVQKADGVFFIPRAEEVPNWVLRSLSKQGKVVCLEGDFSKDGFPSIDLFKESSIHKLLDHLLHFGHERIDCFNNQGHSQGIQQRISFWRDWIADHELGGDLLDIQHPNQYSYDAEMMEIKSYLSRKKPKAVVCTSLGMATQTIRVCRDLNIEVGEDLQLVLMDGEGESTKYTPTITALERPNCSRYLRKCFRWLLDMDEEWSGSKAIQIHDVKMSIGETTVP